MKEKLSAMLDGEISASELGELLDAMRKDPGLRQQYGRFVRAQSSLHNEDGPDIAAPVRARLDAEPTILAPGRKTSVRVPALGRVAAGLAVAATVATIAVGSLNWIAPGDESSPTLVANAPEQVEYVRSGGTRWQVQDKKLEDDLNVYLVEHGGYAGSSAMNGIRSYVKVAGYDE
jgi:anti-sigma factor RsiW